jgi:phytoene dehydrogenase-like protein
VLERRHVVGGACVTEELWPGQRVSRASYVVSMLQPKVVKDLELHRFGYEPIPLDPSFATFAADGRPIFFYGDSVATRASIEPHSRRDAEAYDGFEALLARLAAHLRPAILRPPHAGSLLRTVPRRRRDLQELFRVMTMSVADLLDEWFENDALKGSWASTGVVGVWAGPRTPGTAYNLLHHELGELNGVGGLWGHVKGGMGGISQALARSAEAAGATVRTDSPVRSIDVENGRAVGVTLESGEEVRAPLVISGAHPRTTVLDLTGAEHFPDEVVRDMRRYRSRGGSVKVNCILSEPPRYERASPEDRERLLRTGIAVCPSIDYLERAWQDAVRGEPAAGPYVEIEVPTTVDPTLTDDGTTVMTLFTQYGPHREEDWPEGAREAYAERCLDIVAEHAPNVKDALVHYEVLAPPDLERVFGLVDGSIFQGEQGLEQMAFMRPSPALAQYATPVDGLYLCGAGTHPGGGVMAAGGHNAAQRILKDRRRRALLSRFPGSRSG